MIPKLVYFFFFQHEDLSLLMFERLVDENGLEAEFTKYNLEEKDITFIREQIKGSPETEKGVCIFLSSNNIAKLCMP